jgi:hypothetical protein
VAYDPTRYTIDEAMHHDPDATLEDGAMLYRITSRTYSGRSEILTGNGPANGVTKGRFHTIGQRATYCANNVMVCLAEILFRQYRAMLDGIEKDTPPFLLKPQAIGMHVLVILAIDKIDEIVFADSVGARFYNPNITGPSITTPDLVYKQLHEFSDAIRSYRKKGIVYPSARHSEGFAFALFNDESGKVQSTPYETLELKLQLVSEKQDLSIKPPARFDIYVDKIHPTIGYYEFTDDIAFNDLKSRGLIHPDGLPARAYFDFVRRRYGRSYPNDAHFPC